VILSTDEDGLTISEGSQGTYTVRLTTRPLGFVRITVTSSDPNVATVSGAFPLTFTPSNSFNPWFRPQTVTVRAVNDDIDNDIDSRMVTVTHSVRANLTDYNNIPVDSVAVTVTDDDMLGVTVSRQEFSVPEAGGTRTYTVVLNTQPTADVMVTPRSSDPRVATVLPMALTFTPANWNIPQTVRVTGVDDDIGNDPARTATVTHPVTGGDYEGVTVSPVIVTAIDDEETTVSKTALTLTEAQGTDTYTVVLRIRPTADVRITPTSDDETVATVSGPLIFTRDDWNIPQIVRVTGVDDDIDNPLNRRLTAIRHRAVSNDRTYNGVRIDDVQIRVNDDDIRVTVSTTELSIAEAGGAGTYTVVLEGQPPDNVTVMPRSGTETVTAVSGLLTFTPVNWNIPQLVTVTGVDDDIDNDPDRTATISHTSSGSSDRHYPIASVTVTATDDETAGVTVSRTGIGLAEAGETTYTVVLNSQPRAAVTVMPTSEDETVATVSGALTFNPLNWNVPQTVTVTGVDDTIDNSSDHRLTSIQHTVASADGAYDGLSVNEVQIRVSNDDIGITVLPTELRVDEAGGTGIYSIVLSREPTGPVTVRPTSGDEMVATVSGPLTFTPNNWSQAQTVTVTGVDDNGLNDPDRTATISHRISGGGYDQVSAEQVTVTATDDDTAGLTLSKTGLTVTEDGGTTNYTVVLNTRPTGEVTVRLRSDLETVAMVLPPQLTFTPSNWQTPQRVTVTGVDDPIDNMPNRRATVTHMASGGGYDGVRVDLVAIALDDEEGPPGVTVLPTELRVAEAGGSARYTVVLDGQPTDNVMVTPRSSDPTVVTVPGALTFTPANWNRPQEVTVTGVDDAIKNVPNRRATVTHTASGGGYNNINGASVRVTVADDDTAGVTLSRTRVGLSETGATSYTVRLNTSPTADVTITPRSQDEMVATVSGPLTFTALDWNVPQIAIVTAVDDDIDNPLNRRLTSVEHTVTSTDGAYSGMTVNDVQIRVDDDDITATMSRTELRVAEAGGIETYTVVLDGQPADGVEVTLRSRDPTIAMVLPATLTFTAINWNQPQMVTVTGVGDAIDNDPDRTATVIHTASDGGDRQHPLASVTVTATDDDTAGVTVTPTTLMVDEAGGEGTYTVVLDTQPTADVTVTPTSSDDTVVRVSPPSLTFNATTWNRPQEVTVTGVDDAIDNGTGRTVTVTHTAGGAYGGVSVASVAVTSLDNEDGPLGVTLSAPELLSIAEASGMGTYAVVLDSRPTADVTVTPMSNDQMVATVSGSLTFTPTTWNIPQIVTVIGVDDSIDNEPARSTSISHRIAGGGYGNVPVGQVRVRTTDNDTAGVTVTPTPTDLMVDEAGGTGIYTVVLNTQPTGEVRVTPAIAPAGVVTVSRTQLTFDTTNWSTAQTVTVTGLNDNALNDPARTATISHTIAGGGYDNIPVASVRITATDDDTAGVTVMPTTLMVDEAGGAGTYTIVLDKRPTGEVTVMPESSDRTVATVSPMELTFNVDDWSVPQEVTLTGVNDAIDNVPHRRATVTHTISGGGYDNTAATVTVMATDDDTAGVTLSTNKLQITEVVGTGIYTIVLDSPPTADVTVTPRSDDEAIATVSPPQLIFTPANWNIPQTVTVDVDDDIDNDVGSLSITRSTHIRHTVMSADGAYDRKSVNAVEIDAINSDDDIVGVTVSKRALSIPEVGGMGTYTVVLNTQPTGTVTVTPRSNTVSVATVLPTRLTFTPGDWNIPRTVVVTVTGIDDAIDNDPDRTATVTHTVSGSDYNGVEARSVRVTATDDETAGVSLSKTKLTVTEAGGIGTYTVVLDSEPTGSVMVRPISDPPSVATVSEELTFTPQNWNQPQVVTVTGVDDALVNDPVRTAMVSHQVAGGGYNQVSVASVRVMAIDNDTPGVTVLPTALRVAEAGGIGTYRVFLNRPPSGEVTVTPESSDTDVATVSGELTFNSQNWDDSQMVIVTGVDDTSVNAPARTAMVTHGVSGSGYDGVTVHPVTVTATDDDAGVTVSQTELSVNETDGTETYTVVLDSQPTGTVTVTPMSSNETVVTVSGELTFNVSNWNMPQTVMVSGVDDEALNDPARTTTISHTIVGGGYDEVRVQQVRVTVTDEDTAEVTVRATTLRVDEPGGTARYTIVLEKRPTGDVMVTPTSQDLMVATVSDALTFDRINWNIPQTVTVTVTDDNALNDPDRTTTISHTIAGGGYDDVLVASVMVTATDDDIPGITLSATELILDEADGTARYTIVLDKQPTSDVMVMPTSEDPTVVTVSDVLTFKVNNWNQPQTVTVRGVDDTIVSDPARTARVTHRVAGGGYDDLAVASVMVTATDDDASITLSTTELTITEAGGAASYTVVLDRRPISTVTVTPRSSDEAVLAVSDPLIFTTSNWNQPQTVTVIGVDNAIVNDPSRGTTVTHEVSGGGYDDISIEEVRVSTTDDDAGVTVLPTELTIAEAGGTKTYTVVLNTQPPIPVTVTPTSSDETVAIVSGALTFGRNDWNVPQTVMVTGVDDNALNDPDRTATLTHRVSSGYVGVTAATVTVTATDDETAKVMMSKTSLSVAEGGGMGAYTVMLDAKPTGTVTVTPISSNRMVATVLPTSLIFNLNNWNQTPTSDAEMVATVSGPLTFTTSNWNQPQTVTVTGVDDAFDNSPDRIATISHSIAGGGYDDVSVERVRVTATDDDTDGVTLSTTALSINEGGGMGNYMIRLNTKPTGTVTVMPTSDAEMVATVSGALIFTPANWNQPQTVTVTGVDDAFVNDPDRTATISHRVASTDGNYHRIMVDSVTVTARDNEIPGVTLSMTELTVAENGGMGTYTLVLDKQPTGPIRITLMSPWRTSR